MVAPSTVAGLETTRHSGPNSIGIDTLYEPNDRISDVFLHGRSVPEDFIAYKSCFLGGTVDFYPNFSQLQPQELRCLPNGRTMHCRAKAFVAGSMNISTSLMTISTSADLSTEEYVSGTRCCFVVPKRLWTHGGSIERSTLPSGKKKTFRDDGKSDLAIIPVVLDESFLPWEGEHAAVFQRRQSADFRECNSDSGKCGQQFQRVVQAL